MPSLNHFSQRSRANVWSVLLSRHEGRPGKPSSSLWSASTTECGDIPHSAISVRLLMSNRYVNPNIEVFDRASARHQVTRVEAIAIAFALRRAFSPCRSEKVAQFFTHDFFHHRSRCVANICPQILMKVLWPEWLRRDEV